MEINLGSVITSTLARKIIYGAYVIAGVFFGASSAAFAVMADGVQPEWVVVGLAVLGYLAIPVGGLALVNVGDKAKDVDVIVEEGDTNF